MTIFFYSYNNNSVSATELCKKLGIKKILHENSKFKGSPDRTVINWGSPKLPDEVQKCNIINTQEAVNICHDKVKCFQQLDENCNIPDFTTSKEVAKRWASNNNITVFCRTITRAYGGRGIVQAIIPEEVCNAPLYTKYIPKKDEYRVHICNGKPFLIQRKAVEIGIKPYDWKVRNHANGFIFVRNENHIPNSDVIEQAVKAFNSVKGLTFCSVDVIYNKYRNKAYVLEINTASGLSGTTLDDYATMIMGITK